MSGHSDFVNPTPRRTPPRPKGPTSNLEIHAASVLVQTALALEPAETSLLLGHAGLELRGAVPVADGHVALLPQRVVVEPVLGEVAMDRAVVPVEDGVNLGDLVLVLKNSPLFKTRTTESFSRVRACERRRPASQAVAFKSRTARSIGSTLLM